MPQGRNALRLAMVARIALVLAFAALALVAVLCRYEIVPVHIGGDGDVGGAYRLDRWTGRLAWVYRWEGGEIEVLDRKAMEAIAAANKAARKPNPDDYFGKPK